MVKEIINKTHGRPGRRLAAIYDLCKGKKVCEGLDETEADGEHAKKVVSL